MLVGDTSYYFINEVHSHVLHDSIGLLHVTTDPLNHDGIQIHTAVFLSWSIMWGYHYGQSKSLIVCIDCIVLSYEDNCCCYVYVNLFICTIDVHESIIYFTKSSKIKIIKIQMTCYYIHVFEIENLLIIIKNY